MSMVRYEILLPLRYNNGTPIEDEKLRITSIRMFNRKKRILIGNLTLMNQTYNQTGKVCENYLLRVAFSCGLFYCVLLLQWE